MRIVNGRWFGFFLRCNAAMQDLSKYDDNFRAQSHSPLFSHFLKFTNFQSFFRCCKLKNSSFLFLSFGRRVLRFWKIAAAAAPRIIIRVIRNQGFVDEKKKSKEEVICGN